ncbi:MAG: CvpA family protein [Candidatus Dormibacteraeota bacterium]|nr:CvpA family protein [Candidatus Dormibacteraeota bacterium]
MLSAVDNTLPQFSADALLVVLIILNALLGWRTGTLRRVLSLAGLYIAFLAAFYTGNGVAAIFRKGDIYANAWAFVAILVVVVVLFEVLGAVFADRLKNVAVVAFDRVAATFIGAALGFFQALVLFLIALAVGAARPGPGNTVPASRDAAANAVRGAALSSHAIGAEPVVRGALAPLIPSDLTTHLEDGTQIALHF